MLGATVLAVVITAIVLRRSRVQVTPGQQKAPGIGVGTVLR